MRENADQKNFDYGLFLRNVMYKQIDNFISVKCSP